MTAKKATETVKNTGNNQAAGKKPSASSRGNTSSGGRAPGKNTKKKKNQGILDFPWLEETLLWGSLALCVIVFISNFGVGGFVGNAISSFFFGLFGLIAYVFPVAFFLLVVFLLLNRRNGLAWMKAAAVLLLLICVSGIVELVTHSYDVSRSFLDFYTVSSAKKMGGGLLGGVLCKLFCPAFGVPGAYVLILIMVILCLAMITERSFLQDFRRTGQRFRENVREDAAIRRERAAIREEKQRIIRSEKRKMERESLAEEKKNLKDIPGQMRRDRKARGMRLDNQLDPGLEAPKSVHQIVPPIPREKPEIPEGSLKVMDFTVEGQEFEVPKEERQKKDSPELPFVTYSRTMAEDFRKEAPKELFPRLRENRPGSFEEQLRVSGERYSEEDSFDGPSLKEPVFLRKTESVDEDPFFLEDESETEETPEIFFREEKDEEESELISDTESEEDMEKYEPVDEFEGEVGNSVPVDEFEEEEERPAPEKESAALKEQQAEHVSRPVKNPKSSKEDQEKAKADVAQEIQLSAMEEEPEYVYPPIDLLDKPNSGRGGTTEAELRETAMKLQQTLHNFGVGVRVSNVSCGPSVTRYELTPDQGVKVSRIVNLADDIKLNLAAADIRIEAPIPGKSAVGIEVPNKTNSIVHLRELLESREFREHPSGLAFGAGKDIGGKVVVADIAKMPHLLIAGSTGSGKSVCINTIIMSLLYKADPKDVKLIMIDPKVVELSVYNGIPHLLIPVVTDPKKASGALNWAVAEMTERYEKFAAYNVRDLKGYNKKVESIQNIPGENKPQKLPQIVIIVDELADLMMVAPGEVEDAICRLAQLARAAGLHLIIATQRPSVNVITGLIKANMPSRIAFAVSSGVDSRTIIDMVGAEKLLGKGDMLFYPQGYQKPVRVQGAFVSDANVNSVVEFLKEKNSLSGSSDSDMEAKITQAQKTGGGDSSSESDIDEYFEKAGRFIIEKDKASIGMLQRLLRIGFNRAARIMDQLAEAGVVGPDEGTKPRKILMSMEQFEEYLSDYV